MRNSQGKPRIEPEEVLGTHWVVTMSVGGSDFLTQFESETPVSGLEASFATKLLHEAFRVVRVERGRLTVLDNG